MTKAIRMNPRMMFEFFTLSLMLPGYHWMVNDAEIDIWIVLKPISAHIADSAWFSPQFCCNLMRDQADFCLAFRTYH